MRVFSLPRVLRCNLWVGSFGHRYHAFGPEAVRIPFALFLRGVVQTIELVEILVLIFVRDGLWLFLLHVKIIDGVNHYKQSLFNLPWKTQQFLGP
jgi:hypothetical protein